MFLNLLIPVVFSAPLYFQEQDGASIDPHRPQPVVVEYYTPKRAPVETLSTSLTQMFRANITMVSTGSVPFLSSFGETLLVQAPANYMKDILNTIRECDANYVGSSEHNAQTSEHWQYEVKHVSLNAVRSALQFLSHPQGVPQGRGAGRVGMQVSFVDDRSLVLAQGTRGEIAQAKSIVEVLDVAPPRLMLTCYLVRGAEESSPHLPQDLVRDLGQLVPYKNFEVLSTGVLPNDAIGKMSLRVDLADNMGRFELEMQPSAYDSQTGQLSLSSIDFSMQLSVVIEEQDQKRGVNTREKKMIDRSFSTSTSLHSNQYTVLGAVGANPVFVVVRLSQL